MYCSNCGGQLSSGQKFCPHCGAPAAGQASPDKGSAGPVPDSAVCNHPLPFILGLSGFLLSLAGGILGFFTVWCTALGFLPSAAAWILSYVLVKKGQRAGKRMRLGRVFGILGVAVSLFCVSLLIIFLFVLPSDSLL